MTTADAYLEYIKKLREAGGNYRFRYLIRTIKASDRWFFQDFNDIETIEPIVYWTSIQRRACLFTTEQDVEEFKADYIKPRKSDIIRIDVTRHPEILVR